MKQAPSILFLKVSKLLIAALLLVITSCTAPTKTIESPRVVLLSGPNHHWHDDPALYSAMLGQAPNNWTMTPLDRCANLVSEQCTTSYLEFADSLYQTIQDSESGAYIVAFASSNLTVWSLFHRYPDVNVRGVVLIDPDTLSEQGRTSLIEDTLPFANAGQRLFELVDEGYFDERYALRVSSERVKLQESPNASSIDWPLWEYYASRKLEHERIKFRFNTIIQYGRDLSNSTQWGASDAAPAWPMIIVDTDFEQPAIDSSENPEGLFAWRNENTRWYRYLAHDNPNIQYLHHPSQEHELPLFETQFVLDTLQRLVEATQKQ